MKTPTTAEAIARVLAAVLSDDTAAEVLNGLLFAEECEITDRQAFLDDRIFTELVASAPRAALQATMIRLR